MVGAGSRSRLALVVVTVLAVACQNSAETAEPAPGPASPAAAGVERLVDPDEPPTAVPDGSGAGLGIAALDPDAVEFDGAERAIRPVDAPLDDPAPTTSTIPAAGSPSPTSTSVAPTTTSTVPPTTTTTAPVPVPSPALPAGTWDAAVAGSTSGALTSQAAADGIHVGPGQAHGTITAAVAAAPAGSTIVIHDNGDAYRESFSADAGWIGKPLRFVAAPGQRPVVSGADVVADWTEEDRRWFHQYGDDRFEFPLPTGAEIIASQISGSSPNAGLLEQVFVDGQPLRQLGSLADLGPGSFFVDRDADRIYLGDDPTGRTIEIAARARALMLPAAASGSSIEGITITGFSPRHLDGSAMVVLDGATDVVLRDVVITRSSATGLVAVDADRLVLERASVVANGARGMSGDRLDDLVIGRSRFEANNTERFDSAGCGGGTHCVLAGAKLTRSTGVEVSFSDFSDNHATGFWCDLECRDLVFVANHAVGNARHGAYFEVSEGGVVEGNILADNGRAGLKTSGSRDVRVAHNTFVGNGVQIDVGADYRPGSIGFHTSPETHMRDIDIVDNVFAETTRRLVVIDPVNHDAVPGAWDRLGVVAGNLYLLVDGDSGSEWRFRMADGRFELDPVVAVAPLAVEVGRPMAHFAGGGSDDLRLVGAAASLGAGALSSTAAAFFPALGAIPPGAPLA